jgi:hypothetical protein
LLGNNVWFMECTWLPKMSTYVFPCSNSAMKGNNGTNRILYHDIAAQTINRTSPVFHCWNQAFRSVVFLVCSPNVNCSWCREQRERRFIWPHHVRVSACLISMFYGRDTIVYASEHCFQ